MSLSLQVDVPRSCSPGDAGAVPVGRDRDAGAARERRVLRPDAAVDDTDDDAGAGVRAAAELRPDAARGVEAEEVRRQGRVELGPLVLARGATTPGCLRQLLGLRGGQLVRRRRCWRRCSRRSWSRRPWPARRHACAVRCCCHFLAAAEWASASCQTPLGSQESPSRSRCIRRRGRPRTSRGIGRR